MLHLFWPSKYSEWPPGSTWFPSVFLPRHVIIPLPWENHASAQRISFLQTDEGVLKRKASSRGNWGTSQPKLFPILSTSAQKVWHELWCQLAGSWQKGLANLNNILSKIQTEILLLHLELYKTQYLHNIAHLRW